MNVPMRGAFPLLFTLFAGCVKMASCALDFTSHKDYYMALPSYYEVQPLRGLTVAIHAIAIPQTSTFLFMQRGKDPLPDGSDHVVSTYNYQTQRARYIYSKDGPFCGGHTFTPGGRIVIAGGFGQQGDLLAGIKNIRTFTRAEDQLVNQTALPFPRWYPTLTLMADGRFVIMGGTAYVNDGGTLYYYDLWDPRTWTAEVWPMDDTYLGKVREHYYPFVYVLPNGDLVTICGRDGAILNPNTGVWSAQLSSRPGYAESQYPSSGTSVMLALLPEKQYRVEIVIFGGNKEGAYEDTPAGSESTRIKITLPNKTSMDYSFGTWVTENMTLPRVMGDSVLLPNGIVILLNGGKIGIAGDSETQSTKSKIPNLVAQLYNPYAPVGQRYSTLAQTKIPRLYHSTASLTLDGTVIVTGCDNCNPANLQLEPGFPIKGTKWKDAEFRIEIFYPPFYHDTENKPVIASFQRDMAYGKMLPVVYTCEAAGCNVTRATLVAPSATTHSFNMNQRVVGLVIASNDETTGTLQLVGPPNSNIAPAQWYMLFLLNGDTYSKGVWVKLSLNPSS